jgi:hypothetical protein
MSRNGFRVAAATILGALVAASFAYAKTVNVTGTVLIAGGETQWDPHTDAAGCFNPPDGTMFFPFFYGGTPSLGGPFYGGEGIFVGGINGKPFADPNDKGNLRGRALTVGPQQIGDLNVSVTESALTTPTLRVLYKFENTGGSASHKTIAVASGIYYNDPGYELGSSGGSSLNRKDRWLITNDTPKKGDYPASTLVWFGKHVSTTVRAVDHPGDNQSCLENDFQLTVPAHSVSYLMFFAEQNKTPNAAKKSVAKFNKRHLTKRLLGGIKADVRQRIVNWDVG